MRFPALFLIATAAAFAQRAVPEPPSELLWPNGAPGAVGTEDVDKPALTTWMPKGPKTGQAVVVCPGGGYGALAMDHEGKQIAQWLNSQGIAAFVLKYRHLGIFSGRAFGLDGGDPFHVSGEPAGFCDPVLSRDHVH